MLWHAALLFTSTHALNVIVATAVRGPVKSPDSLLPAQAILNVPYEGLVEAQEAWSRKMLEFIGLPWDPRCLDFHLTERVVRTASATQVRQPIYTSSIGRWRAYEPLLGPLLAELSLST